MIFFVIFFFFFCIFKEYLQPGARFEIVVQENLRQVIFDRINTNQVTLDIFEEVEIEVVMCLQNECIPKVRDYFFIFLYFFVPIPFSILYFFFLFLFLSLSLPYLLPLSLPHLFQKFLTSDWYQRYEDHSYVEPETVEPLSLVNLRGKMKSCVDVTNALQEQRYDLAIYCIRVYLYMFRSIYVFT